MLFSFCSLVGILWWSSFMCLCLLLIFIFVINFTWELIKPSYHKLLLTWMNSKYERNLLEISTFTYRNNISHLTQNWAPLLHLSFRNPSMYRVISINDYLTVLWNTLRILCTDCFRWAPLHKVPTFRICNLPSTRNPAMVFWLTFSFLKLMLSCVWPGMWLSLMLYERRLCSQWCKMVH